MGRLLFLPKGFSVHRCLSVLLILLLAAACSSDPSANAEQSIATTASTASLPLNAEGVPLVARVNGTEITLPQFERELLRTQQVNTGIDSMSQRLYVLETLVDQVLITQAAAEMNIIVSDAELNAEIQANVELAGGTDAWQAWLNINFYTEDEFRNTLRLTLITGRVRDTVTQDIQAVHARHILVRTEAEANEILTRLQAGEDFATLAAQSLDVTSQNTGGDLDWFRRYELMEPSLEDIAFSLQPGQIAGPIPTRLGYHIIQTLEIGERPIEAVDQAETTRIRFENWLNRRRDTATIERYI
jgi:peptidyl-prolyl cis-trans isomerase C